MRVKVGQKYRSRHGHLWTVKRPNHRPGEHLVEHEAGFNLLASDAELRAATRLGAWRWLFWKKKSP
jgi:hypothetical protein